MKYTYKGALTSAPKFLTALMLSTFLVACGGGTSGDGTDTGLTTSGDTDFGDTDFGDTDFGDTDFGDTDDGETDNGLETGGDSDTDSDGNGVSDADQALPCWNRGNGTDENSSDFFWNNNCLVSTIRWDESTYAEGIQRVLYCSGVGGVVSTTAAFADGDFGGDTYDAVRDFQSAENAQQEATGDDRAILTVDGIVGEQTWDRLQSKVFDFETNANAFIALEDNFNLGVETEVLGVLASDYPTVALVDCSDQRNFVGLIDPTNEDIIGWRLTDVPGGTGIKSFSIDEF